MKTFVLFSSLFLALIITAAPAAAQNNLPPEVREMARKVMMPVVYRVPGMDRVKVVQNLKYTRTDDPNVLMDIYLPPDIAPTQKRPVVIFIHGGVKTEYTPKDWGIYTTWGRLIAASGFDEASQAAQSIRRAINRLSEHVEVKSTRRGHLPSHRGWRLDIGGAVLEIEFRICLIAFSAGGPLLSLAMRGETPFVRCLVGFYAFMDIQQSDYRKTETVETLKAFSPITYLQNDANKIPPMFIARAGHDEVPTMDDSIDRFVKEALARNIPLTFANHPQGVHGFDNQNDDERSREIIRNAIAFMQIHLSATGK